VEDDR